MISIARGVSLLLVMLLLMVGFRAGAAPVIDVDTPAKGDAALRQHCGGCHGADLRGQGTYPSLLQVAKVRRPQEIVRVLLNGKFDRAGEIAGRLMIQTDVSPVIPGLSGVLSLGHGDTSDGFTPGKQQELDITIDYRPPAVEGYWFRIRQAWRTLAGETTTDFRVILNYERGF